MNFKSLRVILNNNDILEYNNKCIFVENNFNTLLLIVNTL